MCHTLIGEDSLEKGGGCRELEGDPQFFFEGMEVLLTLLFLTHSQVSSYIMKILRKHYNRPIAPEFLDT